jgi:NAD(P)-dependent dehydrogenase (short-subunit alcohol dehydrogenase family)
MRLSGKIAIITGAGRGVGRSSALAFAREGAKLVLAARTVGEIEAVAVEIRQMGGEAIAVPTDVARTADCDRLARSALDAFGTIDVLVNNAAMVTPGGPTWEVDPDEWMRTQDVNVGGYVRCARAALPTMVAKRAGCLINISSGAGINTMPLWSAYSVSKAAIISLTKNLAEELKPFGVTANSVGVFHASRLWHEQIAAGPVGGSHPEDLARLLESGQAPGPEENDATLVWLASDDARHVTGSFISANGLPSYRVERG